MNTRRLTAMLTTLAAAATLVGSGVPPAGASGTTLSGLTSFGHMAVDSANGHVFVDGASTDSTIAVMNQDGSLDTTITGETGAGGMVLDGSTLYVARCGNPGQIDEIDTTTLTVTGSIAIPSPGIGGRCSLAEANGQLWFSDTTNGSGHLTAVSLDSSHTITTTSFNEYRMLLTSVPGHPDWLVIGETDSSPGNVQVEDVTTPASPTELANVQPRGGSELGDVAVSPDGATLFAGTGNGVQAYSLPGLSEAGWYPSSGFATSVAVNPAGSQLAAGENLADNGAASLFDVGDAAARTSWALSSTSDSVYAGGLAFSQDGGTLFAVSHGSSGSSVVFNALSTSAPAHVPTVTGFSDMVVEPAGRVFVSGGSGSSAIDVFNPDGTLDTTIDGESGAGGMVLDGSILYVERCGWNVIDEIDTDTLTRVGSFPAPVGGLCQMTEVDGRLWFDDSVNFQSGKLESASLDPSHTVVNSSFNLSDSLLAPVPGNPTWLMIGDGDIPLVARIEDVTDPSSPSQVASKYNPGGGAGVLADMALTPGGQLLTADNSPSSIQQYALPGFTLTHSYPIGNYPNAVAVSPSGGLVAAGAESGTGPDVYLFAAGGAAKLTDWSFVTAETLYPRGLAFSSDNKHLYAVTAGASDAGPVLHMLSTTILPKGKVSLTRSLGTVTYGGGDLLTAHLGTSTSSRTLQVWRTPGTGGSPVLVHTGTAGAKGNISLLVHPAVNSTYTVKWAGDSTHTAATASVRVNVRLKMHAITQGGYRTLNGVRLYHYTTACASAGHTGCPKFLSWTGPVQPGRTLTFVAQGRTATGRWVTIAHGSARAGTSGRLLLTLFYSGRGLENVPQRIHFSMAKSTADLGATSGWVHYRVTV